jgi:hypothetical protein
MLVQRFATKSRAAFGASCVYTDKRFYKDTNVFIPSSAALILVAVSGRRLSSPILFLSKKLLQLVFLNKVWYLTQVVMYFDEAP